MAKEIKQEKKVIFKEIISLEDYKKLVYDCLIIYQNCSVHTAKNLMEEYEKDFPEFYEENYEPGTAAFGMAMRYL